MTLRLALIALLGSTCSLLYELILSKVITFYTGELILWQSLTLGTYLAALGLGVLRALHTPSPAERLFALELMLALLGAVMVPILLGMHAIYQMYLSTFGQPNFAWISPLNAFALLCQGVVLAVGFLCGQELPLLFKLASNPQSSSARILTCTYLGALSGAVLFATVFLRFMEMTEAALWTAATNIFLAILVRQGWAQNFSSISLRKTRAALAFVSLCLLAIYAVSTPLHELALKNFYYNRLTFATHPQRGLEWTGPFGITQWPSLAKNYEAIRRVRSAYQTIDFVRKVHDERNYTVYLNGHYQFDSLREKSYHAAMSEAASLGNPRKILVLGGGDGLLLRDLLETQKQIEHITLVELDAQMIHQAKIEPLRTLNKGSLENPKVSTIIDDAFTWLRQSSEQRYDVIIADFPYPYDGESLRLYSSEFYRLLSKRLNEQGYFIADYPLQNIQNKKTNSELGRSLTAAGFVQAWSFQTPGESFVVATRDRVLRRHKPGSFVMTALNADNNQSSVLSILKPHRFMATDPFF